MLFVTSTVLANLFAQLDLVPQSDSPLGSSDPLPATFNQFGVRLRAARLAATPSDA